MSKEIINQINDNLAATIGTQAYIFMYPSVVLRNIECNDIIKKCFKLNEMCYYDEPITPTSYSKPLLSSVPNHDVLYAIAWLELSNTTIILNTPKTKGKVWWTVQLIDANGNTFANVPGMNKKASKNSVEIIGSSMRIHKINNYECCNNPRNVNICKFENNYCNNNRNRHTIYAPTNTVLLVANVIIKNHNIKEANKLLRKINIEQTIACSPKPLSPMPANVFNTLDFFSVGLEVLNDNPPLELDESFINQFKLVGLDYNLPFDYEKLHASTITGLTRAIDIANQIVRYGDNFYDKQYYWQRLNIIGFYDDNFLQRAYMAFSNIGANIKEEVLYAQACYDSLGNPLDGNNNYRIHFNAHQIPFVNPRWGVWIITLYQKSNFNDNSDGIYSIGSNNDNLIINQDGSIDVNIQSNKNIKNWLPVSQGSFKLLLRMYAATKIQINDFSNLPPVVLVS